jgi:AbrB family looped-hinge helix DNA binding protein
MLKKPESAKVVNHGMVNIPSSIRKKLKLKDGDRVWIELNEDGIIQLTPIKDIEEIRKKSYTTEEMMEEMERSKSIELELEK